MTRSTTSLSLKVYVAASSKEIDRAEAVHRALAAIDGVEVVSTWIGSVKEHRGTHERDLGTLTRSDKKWTNTNALGRASVLLFLAPETESRMSWFELGWVEGYIQGERDNCYVASKTIFVSGPHSRDSICTEGYDIYATDEEAIEAVRKMVTRG